MVPDAGRGLRREKIAAGGLEEFQHRLVFKGGRIGEVDHHLRAGHGLFEALAGDAVDAGLGRGGDGLVAALAQNGDGLRADQAGTADDDDLHGLPSLVDDVTVKWGRMQMRTTAEQNEKSVTTDTEASVLNTPLAGPLTTSNATSTRMSRHCPEVSNLGRLCRNPILPTPPRRCPEAPSALDRYGLETVHRGEAGGDA